ncbi:ankyrin [Byssothecium circinans]|uniref:protein S-acyltransferase n=1 Tax=Byssothecium circinans TaxID=147558 RepID=A0A6A5TYY6_9PLEO|nr:ankyrin [Byssothecium circinans]
MAPLNLDEDSIDEILYLSRANEAAELSTYLSDLATSTKRSSTEILAGAVDPYTKNTALHYAAANGHLDIIKLLVSTSTANTTVPSTPASGLINAINDSGNTALHWAALNGHLESVKLLVQAGADVTIINKAGHDSVFEAEINDKGEVVEWLLAAVEELEKGIGQGNDDEGDEGDGSKAEGHTNGEASADGIEDVRRQMEGLDAASNSQGG